jgi:hypothetical protein
MNKWVEVSVIRGEKVTKVYRPLDDLWNRHIPQPPKTNAIVRLVVRVVAFLMGAPNRKE